MQGVRKMKKGLTALKNQEFYNLFSLSHQLSGVIFYFSLIYCFLS